jgi:hypothetical protein
MPNDAAHYTRINKKTTLFFIRGKSRFKQDTGIKLLDLLFFYLLVKLDVVF